MTKDKKHIDFQDLIVKYLSGNADKGEIDMLEKWVVDSESNKNQFNSIRQAWILIGIKQNTTETNIDTEWETIAEKLFNSSQQNIKQLPFNKNSQFRHLWKYAAAIAILLVATILIYKNTYTHNYTNIVAKNEILESRLPDGSIISLNRNSAIKYIPVSNKSHRHVRLEGDAFFKVKRDTSHSFIVSAQDIEVEVLGTSFYVDARSSLSNIYVYVKSGIVSVSAKGKKIILEKNEFAIYNKRDKILVKKQNNNENYLAWKTGVFKFEKARLNEVIFELKRKFKTQIVFENPSLKNCEITATFSNKSLDSIIKIIDQTLHIDSSKEGDKIILSGKNCY